MITTPILIAVFYGRIHILVNIVHPRTMSQDYVPWSLILGRSASPRYSRLVIVVRHSLRAHQLGHKDTSNKRFSSSDSARVLRSRGAAAGSRI